MPAIGNTPNHVIRTLATRLSSADRDANHADIRREGDIGTKVRRKRIGVVAELDHRVPCSRITITELHVGRDRIGRTTRCEKHGVVAIGDPDLIGSV